MSQVFISKLLLVQHEVEVEEEEGEEEKEKDEEKVVEKEKLMLNNIKELGKGKDKMDNKEIVKVNIEGSKEVVPPPAADVNTSSTSNLLPSTSIESNNDNNNNNGEKKEREMVNNTIKHVVSYRYALETALYQEKLLLEICLDSESNKINMINITGTLSLSLSFSLLNERMIFLSLSLSLS